MCVRCSDLHIRVRAAINKHTDFNRALEDLTAFFARLSANPPSGKQPAGSKAELSRSGAQQSSGAGPSAKSGAQPAKPKTTDTAGRHWQHDSITAVAHHPHVGSSGLVRMICTEFAALYEVPR